MACTGSLLNCLICGNELDDQKPLIFSGEGADNWAIFKRSFRSFCRLLNVTEKSAVDEILESVISALGGSGLKDGVKSGEGVFGHPCCSECCGALNEIQTLEQTINEMRASQMSHVEVLKRSLMTLDDGYHYDDNTWSQIRKRIIAGILKRPSFSKPHQPTLSTHPHSLQLPSRRLPNILRRSTGRKNGHVDPKFGQSKVAKETEYILPLDAIDPLAEESFCDDNFDDFSPPSPLTTSCSPRHVEDKLLQEPAKKSHKSNQQRPLSMTAAAKLAVPSCRILLERLPPDALNKYKIQDNNSNQPPPRVQLAKKPKRDRKSSKQLSNTEGATSKLLSLWSSGGGGSRKLEKYGSRCHLITDNILLYKYTLVKISHGGARLSCMERGCSTGTLQDPVYGNYYPVFQKIKNHIDENHDNRAHQTVNVCPAPDCQADFVGTAIKFRSHLLSEHEMNTVACEVCWRPVTNASESYRCHLWSHYNKEERLENALQAPMKYIYKERQKVERRKRKMEESKDRRYIPKKKIIVTPPSPAAPQTSPETPEICKDEPEEVKLKSAGDGEDGFESGLRRSTRKRTEPSWKKMLDEELSDDDNDKHDSGDDFVPSPRAVSEEDVPQLTESNFVPEENKEKEKTEDSSGAITPVAVPNTSAGVTRRMAGNLFHFISEDILLYKFTPIQKSHGGTQLQCLEPDCLAIFQDIDYLSLFEKMKEHVETNHLAAYLEDVQDHLTILEKIPCPLPNCDAEFDRHADFRLRHHLLRDHDNDRVICEICWKPMRHHSDVYKRHRWYHRNNEEKLQVAPPTSVVIKTKLTKKGKYRCLLGRKPPAPAVIEKEKPILTVATGSKKKKKKKKRRKAIPEIPTATQTTTSDYFSKLDDNLLLYKYTLIKVIHGQGLFCQEPGCSSTLVVAPNHPIYCQPLDQAMEHVKRCHVEEAGDSTIYPLKSRQCPLCPAVVHGGRNFRQHLFKVHGRKSFVCPVCWKPFTQRASLTKHARSHMSPAEVGGNQCNLEGGEVNGKRLTNFVCDECGNEFAKAFQLRLHKQRHIPKSLREQWSCDQCPDMFLSPAALRNHIERIHLPPEQRRSKYCPICNKEFFHRDTHKFTVHMRSHRNEKPYVCDICGWRFTSPAAFRMHVARVHTEERKYQCEYCEMNYKHPRNLIRHQMTIHKDKVPPPPRKKVLPSRDFIGPKIAFPCEFCDKIFELRSRMTKHVKLTHGIDVKPIVANE